MHPFVIYAGAALAEIGGCFSFWSWWRGGASVFWLFPGILSLGLFAFLLALVPSEAAGRAFAAYGGIYILASLCWMAAVEGLRPDGYDLAGAAICIAGAGMILLAPRAG